MMGMARSLRVEYAGAYYHVMARENRREEISLDEEDRRFFLKASRRFALRPGGEAEDAERGERESNLGKNGMENPLQKAGEDAR
jgi:hypothetical protein